MKKKEGEGLETNNYNFMRRNIFFCMIFVSLCCIMGYTYSKSHAEISYCFPDNANVYIYIDSIAPSEKVLLVDEDYKSLRNTLKEIKYYNPRIDPTSPENIIWGSTSYAIEMLTGDKRYTVSLGSQEIKHGIRTLYISYPEECLAAYVSDDIFQEISDLFLKYFDFSGKTIGETEKGNFK